MQQEIIKNKNKSKKSQKNYTRYLRNTAQIQHRLMIRRLLLLQQQ